jgi:hypothetical protein
VRRRVEHRAVARLVGTLLIRIDACKCMSTSFGKSYVHPKVLVSI